MKKIDIINLIKASVQNDSDKFKEIADSIANEFYESGDKELGDTVFSFVHNGHTLVPQSNGKFFIASPDDELVFLTKKEQKEINEIINSINKNSYPYIFNFVSSSERKNINCAKMVAQNTYRELYLCDVHNTNELKEVVDYINHFIFKDRVIFCLNIKFDCFKEEHYIIEHISENNAVILSNVHDNIIVHSDYNLNLEGVCRKNEAIEIALNFYGSILDKYNVEANSKLVKKILLIYVPKTKYCTVNKLNTKIEYAIASSDPNNEKDYYKMLIKRFDYNDNALDIKKLRKKGFSLREIERITGISKTMVGRKLNNEKIIN